MARARNLKPGFFQNETLAELPPLTRILFAGIWTIADRDGRLEDRPKRIKAAVLPYDRCNVEEMLQSLHEARFIVRYEADGEKYICIPTWCKHQNPHVREAPSTIPAPVEHSASTVPEPFEAGSSTEKAVSSPASFLIPSSHDSLNPENHTPHIVNGKKTFPFPDFPEFDSKAAFEELYIAHPFSGMKSEAEYEFNERMSGAGNPERIYQSIKARHAKWCAYWKAKRHDRKLFKPFLGKWLKESCLHDPPEEPEPTQSRVWKLPDPEPESPPRKEVEGKVQ